MITNGYATLDEFKSYRLGIDSQDSDDDEVIENCIEAASRYTDRATGRTFYARTETHYFDVPVGSRLLILDDDLLVVATLKNGSGETITTAHYDLVPKNKPPYYAVKIKQSSSLYWSVSSAGDSEDVISLAGTWGYSTTAPDDIQALTLELANNLYARRIGQSSEGVASITAAGVVLRPADVPGWARDVLTYYRRRI